MLCCVIQREVDHLGIEHKRIIAQVILNRVRSERFPDTVSQVLHQKNQFPTIINYYETTFIPDEVTVRAASDMISGNAPDMSRGALFFYDPEYTSEKAASWFEEELEYLFTMDCHRFFKYP